MKICTRCNESREDTDFRLKVKGQSARRSICKFCANKLRAKWAQKNPSKVQAWLRQYNYGITSDEYSKLWATQGGLCVVCGASESVSGRQLDVEHCHETGTIRGLACNGCNTGVGITDNPDLLVKKAMFLLKHGKVLSSDVMDQFRKCHI